MPKRVIGFDAMWASDKLSSCAEWAQAEYAWFYGLADASGSFELTNLRVIWGRVAAVRKNLTLERLTEIFEEFAQRGLLFIWEQNGKRYGHWTGSDVPGRLPPPSWRMRLERLAPPVPRPKLAAYLARFSGSEAVSNKGTTVSVEAALDVTANQVDEESANGPVAGNEPQLELKLGIEATQAQEWGVDLDWKKKGKEREVCGEFQYPDSSNEQITSSVDASASQQTRDARPVEPIKLSHASEKSNGRMEEMFAIYDEERGPLPLVNRSSEEIRRQCLRRVAQGLSPQDFRSAVRRAAATPFLAGGGGRGWCATFDWFMANDDNVRKVLAGRYEPPGQYAGTCQQDSWRTRAPARTAISEARTGTGPLASAVGAQVKAATLERIRAREELRARTDHKEKAS